MAENEIRFAEYGTDQDYDLLLCAYGTVARVCLTALEELAERGIRVGLFRPVSLYPFPYEQLRERALAGQARSGRRAVRRTDDRGRQARTRRTRSLSSSSDARGAISSPPRM